jgi:pyruvate/2-oxoglutarate dehydrogenase complex dihydrolipoamide dehydrogenase (E3) component
MGGGVKGAEVALFLAEHGENVTILEMLDQVALDIEPISRQDLLARLKANNVRMITGVKILACENSGLQIRQKGRQEAFIDADKAIPCLGYRPLQELEKSFEGKALSLHTIGDCRKPRMIINAISEAYETASKI